VAATGCVVKLWIAAAKVVLPERLGSVMGRPVDAGQVEDDDGEAGE
jgi:hypothetical protein